MPYAKNGEINIYYEVEGEGTPLVLAHGGGGNLKLWRNFGYTDALKNDYQLILFDFRAHGKSDKPHQESDYGGKLADDVVAILDELKIPQANYYGFSTGGLIGLWLATHYPDRFNSFIFMGVGAFEFPESMLPNDVFMKSLELLATDPDMALHEYEKMVGRNLSDREKDEFLARDGKALIAMFTAQPKMVPLTNDELTAISQPCLLCCGEIDPFYESAKETVKYIPNAEFISFTGLDHVSSWRQSDIVLPHIKEFLAKVNN